MPRLTSDEARARFAAARVARLATADAAGHPHLVPVVFAVHPTEDEVPAAGQTGAATRVTFAVDHKPKRTAALRRLANIRANPAVCLLVDAYDEDWAQLWWSRCDGRARVLPPGADSPRAARLAALLADKYPRQYEGAPPAGPVVEITVARWSGWRAG